MTKVTGADNEVDGFGDDLSATWASVQNLADAFQAVCDSKMFSSFVMSIIMPRSRLLGVMGLTPHFKMQSMLWFSQVRRLDQRRGYCVAGL